MYLTVFITLLLIGICWVSNVESECLNGCSSRGLCVNDICECAEGLSGPDCSSSLPSPLPTLYECPSCYTITVGSPRYYSGPSWRIPDSPIVGLNFKGTLKVFQGNGNAELVSEGTEIDDWLTAPHVALKGEGEGKGKESMDSCGSWLMRAFTSESGKVLGFYHAETACDYHFNHQTIKSGAYSESLDGGNSFTKPQYPNNRLISTNSSFIPGVPSGEGDFSVVLRGDFYYLFFANVEQFYTGVARAPKSSGAVPGSFKKFYEGSWDSPGVGGKSSGLKNIGGPQAYLHTPSQSFVAVGNSNPYWDRGFQMSASDDAVNWNFFGDPITTPDPVTNNDQFMYPSFLGRTGGYDIGNSFQYFYLWVPPGDTWSFRYQIVRDITLTYVGYNNTEPSTKVALTTYRSDTTGETWQSTELAFAPYKPVSIIGYLMTRPYVDTFPVYDCYNYTTNDHFVGTATDCFHSSAGVEVLRILGHIWSVRTPHSISVYRCHAPNDYFLSTDGNCEGRAPSQSTPFGYIMKGPALTEDAKGYDVLLSKGSAWKFHNGPTEAEKWNQVEYDDSQWLSGLAPFGASYSPEIVNSFFGKANHYFRANFTIPQGRILTKLLVSLASDNWAKVYVNGFLVDSDPLRWHEAAYWNRRISVNTSILFEGTNQISVVTYNEDEWAFFDLEISAKYANIQASKPVRAECSPTCAYGECVHGKCMCDYGWGGSDCNTYLCSFSDTNSQVVIPQGSSFRYTPWRYVPSTPVGWFAPKFDDSWWHVSSAPFATNSYNNIATTVGGDRHLYRKQFLVEVQAGETIAWASLSIASDDTHRIYINGKFVGTPILPYTPHSAQHWNEVLNVTGSVFVNGVNLIAVEIPRADWRWTQYFDMQLEIFFSTRSCSPFLSFPLSSRSLSPPSADKLSTPSSSPSPTDKLPTPSPFFRAPSPLLQLFYGSNAWWVSMSVVNSSDSVTALEIKDGGQVSSYTPMLASPEDTFLYIPVSSALILPLSVRATSQNSSLFFLVDSFYPFL